MFDFENFDVYKKAKDLNKEVLKFLKENKQIDIYIRDQLKRASKLIFNENQIEKEKFDYLKQKFETISKMLFGLINSQR